MPSLGSIALKDGSALRIGLPFGQVKSQYLESLAALLESHAISDIRPAPDRTFVLIGRGTDEMRAAAVDIAALGFWTAPDVPGMKLTLCSGAEPSSSGVIHAAQVAAAFAAHAPDLIDGSIHIHVSACAKGCAHRGRPGLMLSGDALYLYRGNAQNPLARLGHTAIEDAIVHLAAGIRDSRRSGGTTLCCLERLGHQ